MHRWRSSDHCNTNGHKIWNMFCSGEYPEEMNTKYGGYKINADEPYTVFCLEKNPKHYLVFLRSTDVSQCVTLEYVNKSSFYCLADVGKPTLLSYPKSHITCIDYSFSLVDELVSYCSTRNLPNSEYTAIVYAEYNEVDDDETVRTNNRCSVLCTNTWLILVIALISLFFIFRLRQ